MTRSSQKQDKIEELRRRAEADLSFFIRLVSPYQVLGGIHEELINWWTRPDALSHQLVLLPRDHGKSRMVAYRVAWEITRNPTITILYISATSTLAEKQLYFIKNILESPIYRQFWPEMIHPEEGKREKWSIGEICVDHPLRKKEGIRDSTVYTAGLTSTITGLHFDIAVLDDVVVKENAYTEEGRRKVSEAYSLLASIESGDSQEWVVGTRYHPKDLYDTMMSLEEDIYDEDGNVVSTNAVYEVFERKVESRGDGTGEFLWPRQQREDGKWFGFNKEILAKKRAKYVDKTQYYAQYYNNPNSPGTEKIPRSKFQYYDRKFVKKENGHWFYKDRKLNISAAIDFAFSLKKRADYTALVVMGTDGEGNHYVLDIDRARTDKISEYFDMILAMYIKWGFRQITAEANSAQAVIIKEIRENYIKPQGLALSIKEKQHTRWEGTKEERNLAILQPRYENMQIWHYQGGNCQTLEEELVMSHPAHDDLTDALASAIDAAVPPTRHFSVNKKTNIVYHPRFGGIA